MENKVIVPTGRIVQEYLDEYNITQKELALKTGMTEEYVSKVLNGKEEFTEGFAANIEKVLKCVSASYFTNYEKEYRKYLNKKNKQEIAVLSRISFVLVIVLFVVMINMIITDLNEHKERMINEEYRASTIADLTETMKKYKEREREKKETIIKNIKTPETFTFEEKEMFYEITLIIKDEARKGENMADITDKKYNDNIIAYLKELEYNVDIENKLISW